MDNTKVRIHCTVLPDGTLGESLRVSLLLTPATHSEGVELARWPEAIAALDKVYLYTVDSNNGVLKRIEVKLPKAANWMGSVELVQEAQSLWSDIFRCGPKALHETLAAQQTRNVKLAGKSLMRSGSVLIDPEMRLGYFPSAEVAEMIRAHLSERTAVRTIARLGKRAGVGDADSWCDETARAFAAEPFSDPLRLWFNDTAEEFVPTYLRSDGIGRMAEQARSQEYDRVRKHNADQKKPFYGFPDESPDHWNWRDRLVGVMRSFGSANVSLDSKDEWFRTRRTFERGKGEYFVKALAAHDTACPTERIASEQRERVAADASNASAEACARKLAAIRSNPTLAKFLGLIVDFTIPRAELEGMSDAFLAASVDDQPVIKLDKTAFTLEPRGRTWFFWIRAHGVGDLSTAGSDGFPSYKAAYHNDIIPDAGVIDVRRHYKIEVMEPGQTLRAMVQRAGAQIEALAEGSMPGALDAKEVAPVEAGLQLLDTRVANRVASRIGRSRARSENVGNFLFAEDLVTGLRPDVMRERRGSEKPARWYSLTARNVTVVEVDRVLRDRGGWYDDAHFRERDHGVVRLGTKLVPTGSGTSSPAPSEVLFGWRGDSLGLPSADDVTRKAENRDYDEVVVDPDQDIAVTIDYRPSRDYKIPMLRVGDRYWFGLRGVLPNGSSLTLSEAEQAYKVFRIGDQDGKGYPYRVHDDVRTPQLLLPTDDALVVAPPKHTPNERPDRVVLRATGGALRRMKVRRYLVPARTTHERAEQFGLWDDQTTVDQPTGAFDEYFRSADSGEFPFSRKSRRNASSKPAPAPLLEPGQSKAAMQAYFPDPQSRYLSIRIERGNKVPPGYSDAPVCRAFWPIAGPRKARPIALDFIANDKLGRGGHVRGKKSTELGGRKIPLVALEVAPAERVTLWYWARPCRKNALETNARFASSSKRLTQFYANLLGKVQGILSLEEAADGELYETWKNIPQNGLGGWGTIEVVHAVERPLEAPRPMPEAQLSVRIVRVGVDTKWPNYAATALDASDHGMSIPDQIGGTVGHCVGSLNFHRRSSEDLRVTVSWRDHGPNSVRRVGAVFEFAPPPQRTLILHAKSIPYDVDAAEPVFDLLADEKRDLRPDFHDFGDGAARLLRFEFASTSRFTRDFTLEPSKQDLESRRFEAWHGTLFGGNEPGEIVETWLRATNRPARPVVERVVWVTREFTRVTDDGRIVVEKRCHPRVYFPSWHSSGEGELLAVVLAPDNAVGMRPIADEALALFEPGDRLPEEHERADEFRRRSLKDLAASVLVQELTRWGSDPTAQGYPLEPLIAPERFSGYVGSAQCVYLPPTTDDATDPKNRADGDGRYVSVLLYRPVFDRTTGEWYADIGIDAGPAHLPFVQLSLARFQPQVIDVPSVDLRLSAALAMDPLQIPAKRTVEVRRADEMTLQVSIKGIAHTRRLLDEVGDAAKECREMTDVPVQDVRLLRKVRNSASVALFTSSGDAAAFRRLLPVMDGPELHWRCEFPLPDDIAIDQLRVDVDEVELHFRDLKDAGCHDFAERKTMFACTVDLAPLRRR